MLPALLGLGGLTARIVASAVIPRVVRAISRSFNTTKANEPCAPPAVEGISSVSNTAPGPTGSGVFVPRESLRKWGYAGLWRHQASGLDLATYRAYDAANKRWISRDPLGEGVDLNLYRYCGNDPINSTDGDGLLKRNPNGSLIFKPEGSPQQVLGTLNCGEQVLLLVQKGYLYADDGTPIPAMKYLANYKNRKKDADCKSNCYGDTFADGQYWVDPDQKHNIIFGDNYKEVPKGERVRGGDVVLYDVGPTPAHSMSIQVGPQQGDRNAITNLSGKNGPGPRYVGPYNLNSISPSQRDGLQNMYADPNATPSVYRK